MMHFRAKTINIMILIENVVIIRICKSCNWTFLMLGHWESPVFNGIVLILIMK